MSALACGVMAASCGEDDESAVALTGLRVSPDTVAKAVGETQQLTVTKVPDNAADAACTWTSSNESVATVSNAGLVTIAAIGTATVTVASGDISAKVTVTGTAKSLTVADADGRNAGMYPFADEDITFTLTAAVDPAGTALTWSASAQNVTVTPSADGLTATVTITDAGNATVTVAGGNLTATYTISTQTVLESAVGYWTFDDPDNLLAATYGEAVLELGGWDDATTPIAPSDGPAADNGAINIPRFNYLNCFHGIAPNGPEGATNVNEYTIMFDVMEEDASKYHALINCEVDANLKQTDEAGMYLKSGGRIGSGHIGDSPNGTTENGKWYRIVFSVKIAAEAKRDPEPDGALVDGYYNYYLNGELLKENAYTTVDQSRTTLRPYGVSFFGDSRPIGKSNGIDEGVAGDGYDFGDDGLHVAAIAIWDHPLTTAEIASLGGFAAASE